MPRSTVPMIATASFVTGAARVRRWSRFLERLIIVPARLKMKQAMEDVTVAVPGLDLGNAKALARAGRFTLHSLAELDDEELVVLGFDDDAVAAVRDWRVKLAAKAAEADPDDFTTIADVGKATAGKLKIHGVLTFSALEVQTEDMLSDAGLSSAAIVAVQAWQDGRRGDG